MTVAPFADIAVAIELAAKMAAREIETLELTGASIGLPKISIDLGTSEHREQARLLADACKVMKGLLPIEHTVRAVLSSQEGWRR